MTIRDRDKFFAEHWDWGFLREHKCFGETRIEPTDIDGIVERCGLFLFIECKSPGVPIGTGQDIMHKALVNTGVVTVVRLWGNAENHVVTEIEVLSRLGDVAKRRADLSYFILVVKRWFLLAEEYGKS